MNKKTLLTFLMMSVAGFVFGMDFDPIDNSRKLSSFYNGRVETSPVSVLNGVQSPENGVKSPDVTNLRKQAAVVSSVCIQAGGSANSNLSVADWTHPTIRKLTRKEDFYNDSFEHCFQGETVIYAEKMSDQDFSKRKEEIEANKMKPRGSCIVKTRY